MQNLQNYMMKMNNSKNDNMKYYIASGVALVLIVILIVLLTNSKSTEGYDYTGTINKFKPSQNPIKTFLRHDLTLNRPVFHGKISEKSEQIKSTFYFTFWICDDDKKAEYDALIEKGEDLSDQESTRLNHTLRGCKYDKDNRIVFDEFFYHSSGRKTTTRQKIRKINDYFDWENKGGKYVSFQLEGRPESKKVPIAYATYTYVGFPTKEAIMRISLTEIPDVLEFNCKKTHWNHEREKDYSPPHDCPQWWAYKEAPPLELADPDTAHGGPAAAEAAGARAIPPGKVSGIDVDSRVYDNVTIRIYDAEPA